MLLNALPTWVPSREVAPLVGLRLQPVSLTQGLGEAPSLGLKWERLAHTKKKKKKKIEEHLPNSVLLLVKQTCLTGPADISVPNVRIINI